MSATNDLDGYVDDASYPSNFHPHFQPAWIDAALLHHRLQPPRRERGAFTLVDLGCGDGIGLVVAAAAHPEAHFIGIDIQPQHIERGRALVAALELDNIELQCSSIQQCLREGGLRDRHGAPIRAEYLVAQGVLTWVSAAVQSALYDLAAHVLAPHGVFALGYNAMPGWASFIPLQRLVQSLSIGLQGSSADRFEAALALVRASGLIDAGVVAAFDARQHGKPRDYFVHEYLNEHWNPQWSGDVLRALHGRGLAFAGEAHPLCLRPDWALRRAWQDALQRVEGTGIEATVARALGIDLVIDRRFRVDLFAGPELVLLPPAAARRDKVARHWAATTSVFEASFRLQTPAGEHNFAGPAARAVVDALQEGPASLQRLVLFAEQELIDAVDALWIAEVIRPAEPASVVPDAVRVNAALKAMAGGADAALPMNALVGRHGGVAIPRSMMAGGLSDTSRRRLGVD